MTHQTPPIPQNLRVPYRAYQILMDILTTHGNQPSRKQQEVLLNLLKLYFQLSAGQLRRQDKRVVAALPTGYGKTSSIVAFIVALHEFGIDHVSVAVTAAKVEALAELKRELVNKAGPSILEKVGLLHSYKYDPEEVRAAREERRNLKDGYASTQSLDGNPEDRQFLLLTHSRLRNAGREDNQDKLSQYTTYRGQERSLMIYDESLLPADVLSFRLGALKGEIEYARNAYPHRKGILEAIQWLDKAHETLAAVPGDQQLAKVPKLSEADQRTFESTLQGLKIPMEACTSCVNLAGATARLHPTDTGMVASYSMALPEEIKRMVVLDASHVVRELTKEDKRMTSLQDVKGYHQLRPFFKEGLKQYPKMDIRIMRASWGRSEIDKEFADARDFSKRRFINDLVKTIQGIPEDQAVLVFVYKDRGRISQRTVLVDALESAGVDTEATMEDGRPRINISTWGSETSTNDFAHCQHVILAGVMQLPRDVLLGHYLAAKDDLEHPYPADTASAVGLSESAHLIYQAASRGACRGTDHRSEAPRMTLWMPTPRLAALKPYLQKVFPGAKYREWQGDFGKQSETKVTKLAKRITDFLMEFQDDGGTRISTRKLKTVLDLQDVPRATFSRAIADVSDDDQHGWVLEGQSLVFPFGEASE